MRLNGKNACDLHSRRFVEILWFQRFLSCYVGRTLLGTQQQHRSKLQFLLNGSLNPIVLKLEQYRQRLSMWVIVRVLVVNVDPRNDSTICHSNPNLIHFVHIFSCVIIVYLQTLWLIATHRQSWTGWRDFCKQHS